MALKAVWDLNQFCYIAKTPSVTYLAIVLANPRVPDSPTTKIKTVKISETQILARFSKISTCQNYQPYGSHNPNCYNIVNECSYGIMSVFRMAASDLSPDLKSNIAPTEIYMVR